MRFLAPDDLKSMRPSFSSGLARNSSESAYPHLWQGLKGLWCPSVGIQGRTLYDFSGYGRHGTFSTGMGSDAWVPSPWGWALRYDGTNDCVNLGTNIVDLNGDFTILFRARLDDIATDTYCGVGASVAGSGASGYIMFIHKANKSGYVLQYDDGPMPVSAYSTSPNRPAVANVWYTMIMRRMASGIVMYQDSYITINDASTNPTFVPGNTQTWGIGASDAINAGVLFKGQIGDVMIWDRGLGFSEMNLLSQGIAHPLALAQQFTFIDPKPIVGVGAGAGMMLLMGDD